MCVVLSLPVPCESAIAPCVQDADKGLKKLKLEHENDHPGFVDALISEYGVGLKQARSLSSPITAQR